MGVVPGAVNPDELIKYAHRISQASSVVSPVGWKLSKLMWVELRVGIMSGWG